MMEEEEFEAGREAGVGGEVIDIPTLSRQPELSLESQLVISPCKKLLLGSL